MMHRHGDVVNLVDVSGNIVNSYTYDFYGNITAETEGTPNPFKYAGEHQTLPNSLIYLRNRIYSPALGRFLQEDPIRDGTNWYVYCNSNPVNYWDPLGLFDYDERLSYSQLYNQDVEALQNELVNQGYMDTPSDNEWGYFGPSTLAAVNAYKNDMGLGNTAADYGVVGIQTWSSLGLTYRTQDDINAGVEIVMVGGRKQYKDFTTPINNALNGTIAIAENKFRFNYPWFVGQVDNNKPWDVKVPQSWNVTIGANTYPGWGEQFVYNNDLMTPEELGNYTYGYIGAAMGLTNTELYGGSWYAANFPVCGEKWENEYNDWFTINKGASAYRRK